MTSFVFVTHVLASKSRSKHEIEKRVPIVLVETIKTADYIYIGTAVWMHARVCERGLGLQP